MLLSLLLLLAPRQPLSEQSHPAASQPYLGAPRGVRPAWALPHPKLSPGSTLGVQSLLCPSQSSSTAPPWVDEGDERGLSLPVWGLVPLGTANVTWTHTLPNIHTCSHGHINTHKPAPTSIHPQIFTHTHMHTHTQADASSKANAIIISFHPEANGQPGILLPGWLLLL